MSATLQTPTTTQPAIPKTVKGWLSSEYFKTQVALCLPKHLTADRFVRVALTALTRTPKLALCTPDSVIKCMMTCSELGIEPDGRRAHLIPYENRKRQITECQLIIDYKGLVELAKRSGDVSNISANIVCENDGFEYDTGEVSHKIDFKRERGPMYAAYAIISFKDGSKHCEVMTKSEIDSIRRRSRAGNDGPWVTDYNEMAKKTVFRRSSKWITLSPEIADALEKDADAPPSIQGLVNEAAIEFPQGESPAEEPKAIDVESQASSVDEKEEADAGLAPKDARKSTPQGELAGLVIEAGFNFDNFKRWGKETGNLTAADLDAINSFDEVPAQMATRFLRAKAGLLKGLAVAKGSAQ